MTEDPQPIVRKALLTATNRWPTPSRIAIGLAKAGWRVSAICPTRGHPLVCTRAVERVLPYSSLRPLESLLTAIEACAPDLIIPSDDRGVQHLHELHAEARNLGPRGAALADLIEYSLGPSESFAIVSSRCELLRIACEEGVRVPETMPIGTEEDLKSWQTRQPLPWVLKGDGTFGGKGVRIARTEGEAGKSFLELRKLFGAARGDQAGNH